MDCDYAMGRCDVIITVNIRVFVVHITDRCDVDVPEAFAVGAGGQALHVRVQDGVPGRESHSKVPVLPYM